MNYNNIPVPASQSGAEKNAGTAADADFRPPNAAANPCQRVLFGGFGRFFENLFLTANTPEEAGG